jgi:zinc/manganese transport system substrate-binding protein
MRLRTKTSIILATALAAVTLVGCSSPQSAADDGTITIVASTNVYGDIAAQVGGDLVEITSIIDDPSQDPHSFEADARVQLDLSKADIVVHNGGGYDPFVEQLLASLDVPQQVVVSAVEVSPLDLEGDDHAHDDHAHDEHAEEGHAEDEHADHDHADDEHAGHDHGAFNEHVWYDFSTVAAVASSIRDALVKLDPDNAEGYDANTAHLQGDLDLLTQRAASLSPADELGVAVTEPVALYLLEAIGLHNETPDAFTQAIEGGTEVSAAALNETLSLFSSGVASILVYNDQTTSPETEALKNAAADAGAPIVAVTELLPAGDDYVNWMNDLLDELEGAIQAVR